MTLDNFITKLEVLRSELGGQVPIVVEINRGKSDYNEEYEDAILEVESAAIKPFGRYVESYIPGSIKVIKVY